MSDKTPFGLDDGSYPNLKYLRDLGFWNHLKFVDCMEIVGTLFSLYCVKENFVLLGKSIFPYKWEVMKVFFTPVG